MPVNERRRRLVLTISDVYNNGNDFKLTNIQRKNNQFVESAQHKKLYRREICVRLKTDVLIIIHFQSFPHSPSSMFYLS